MLDLERLTSRAAVEQAIHDFDKLGRSSFLQQHGMPRSQRWFIDYGGQYYDADAVLAAAYGIQYPDEDPLAHGDLEESDEAVAKALSRLDIAFVEDPYRFLVLAENESHARAEFAKWQDVTGERYHFPNIYRNRIVPGREFVYYKGARRKDGRRATPEYFGWGCIGSVYADPSTTDKPKVNRHWLCDIEEYREFVTPVPFKDDQGHYIELNTSTPPQRYWETGVRLISERAFSRILAAAGVALKVSTTESAAQLADVTLVESSDLLVKTTSRDGATSKSYRSVSRRSPRAKAIGDVGERLFMELLLKQAATAAERAKITWVSKRGETPGWDIEDRRQHEAIAYEIKATNGPKLPAIEVTANEWSAAARLRGRYNLVVIAECESRNPKVQVINDPWGLFEQQQLSAEPTLFRLARK